ncbi:MAG: Tad domain-containing protein [Gammaproteobacteria bacterium]|nr:Tad domain-containing protein [Gammaproteobacteria bacterium]
MARKNRQSFPQDIDGTIAPLFGLMAMPMFLMIGVAVDAGQAFSAKKELQSLVDKAAIAGARLPATTDDRRLAAAEGYYAANLPQLSFDNVSHTIDANNAEVKVSAQYSYQTAVMRLVGFSEIPLKAVAAARPQIDNGSVACILALNETMSDAFHLQGINESNSQNCWVWVNSNSASAISATGGAVATAQGFCAHGAADGREHFGPQPYLGCSRLDDPFKAKFDNYQPPSLVCDHTDLVLRQRSHRLQPGVYCGDTNFTSNARVTLEPGLYVMKHGSLNVDSGATLQGDGVTIFFWGENTFLTVSSGSNLDLRAPSEGELAGFVLVDRKLSWYNPNISETVINGGGSIKIEGVMYAPQWRVNISGNSEMNQDSGCFAMIADNFHMEGNGKLNVVADCQQTGLPQIMPKIKSGPMMMY